MSKKIAKQKKVRENEKAIASSSISFLTQPYLLLFFSLFITLICYLQAFNNGWTYWDDNAYVFENNLTKSLSFSTLKYFFTTYQVGNYHPLAMLSLAVDYKLAGMNAGWFHIHNVLLHLVNVVLVFLLVWLLTKKKWAAAITALLFGIHPMHVESVAWISERKDLLYVLYYLAGLIAYLKFIQPERKPVYFILAIFFFLLSLLSKGQAVTFSVALLLIDYYLRRPFTAKLWLEKIPFFLLSVIFGIIAVLAQHEIKALHLDIPYTLTDRLLFASNSFLAYIYKLVFPLSLVAFYPYPRAVSGHYDWIIYTSPLILLGLIAAVIYSLRKGRVVAFGFAFFFINVILILQILAVGGAVMAERYTYLSYLGLFFIVGIGIQSIMDKQVLQNSAIKFLSVAGVLAFSVFFCIQTVARTKVWKGNESLFGDMLKNYPDIPEANYSLGLEYEKQQKLDLALQYYTKAIEQFPTYKEALVHRFDMYRQMGQTDSAIADCNKLVKIDKNDPGPYANRGIAYCIGGKYDLAMADFNKAIKLDSNNVKAIGNRGNLYDLKGKYDSALADYDRALKLDTGYYDGYGNRGRTYFHKGLFDEAIKDLTLAIKYQPDNGENYALRSDVNNAKGNYRQALNDVLTAQSKGKVISEGYIDALRQKFNEEK